MDILFWNTTNAIANIDFNKVYLKKADGSVTKRDIERPNIKKITEDKPAEYFRDCFQKMEQMVSDIQGLLNQVPVGCKS